jgi:hypothetical protein
MAALLNTSSILMCPHGGTVSAITSNTRVNVGGGPAVLSTDTFVIAGCPFVIGTVPHPCMQVQWVQPDARNQVNSTFTLSESSVGLCVAADMSAQGTVLINFTQAQVSGQ